MKESMLLPMLAMVAANTSEDVLLDTAITALEKYKLSKDDKDTPFSEIFILLMKFKSRGMSPLEMMRESLEETKKMEAFLNLTDNSNTN
jgi:hypothetical protein